MINKFEVSRIQVAVEMKRKQASVAVSYRFTAVEPSSPYSTGHTGGDAHICFMGSSGFASSTVTLPFHPPNSPVRSRDCVSSL